jgi:hypothetical protein
MAQANPTEEGDLEKMLLAVEDVAVKWAERVPPCGGNEIQCARTTLEALAQRLFRDPSASEVDRLMTVFTTSRTQLDFRDSLAAALEALLLHPEFIYLLESRAGETQWQLSPREAARRLSFSLTGSVPTPSVLEQTNALVDAPAIGQLGAQLANSPKGKASLRQFLLMWLDLEDVDFSALPAARTAALKTELNWLIDRALTASDGPGALFRDRTAWVNTELEAFYDLPRVSKGPDDFREAELPRGARSGLITHPLVMAHLSHGNEGATILRGKLLLQRALCIDLGTPPANAGAVEGQLSLPATATSRQRYEARIQNPTCAGCHQSLDPLGFALDGFDGQGRVRPGIDTSGTIPAGDVAGDFASLEALGEKLASSTTSAQCLTKQWLRFSLGRKEGNDCGWAALSERWNSKSRRLIDLFIESTAVESFSTRHAIEVSP